MEIDNKETEMSAWYENDELKPIDFFFAKNNIYKWNELDIDETEKNLFNEEKFEKTTTVFDLWEKRFHLRFVHMDDNLKFHYAVDAEEKCIPFIINIENIAATITRGNHLKRQIYIEPFAIGQASSLFNIHSHLMGIANEKMKDKKEKITNFLDFALLCLNAGRLPINKITYFKNLAVYYEGVEKVLYRGKEKYCLVARVISGKILLPKKNQCYNCNDNEKCNKDCFK